MATSDTSVLLPAVANPPDDIVKHLKIIILLLRQGFNIQDENSSLEQQPLPFTSSQFNL